MEYYTYSASRESNMTVLINALPTKIDLSKMFLLLVYLFSIGRFVVLFYVSLRYLPIDVQELLFYF